MSLTVFLSICEICASGIELQKLSRINAEGVFSEKRQECYFRHLKAKCLEFVNSFPS